MDPIAHYLTYDRQAVLMFLRRGSKEWHLAWKRLKEQTGIDPKKEDPRGECWQYMGTTRRVASRYWWHEFRHRQHPETQERTYVRVATSLDWDPIDEEVRRKPPTEAALERKWKAERRKLKRDAKLAEEHDAWLAAQS
jgi:hypothetical protein